MSEEDDSGSDSEGDTNATPPARKRGRPQRSFNSTDSGTVIKETFKGRKTKVTTKSNYRGKLEQIKAYFVKYHPEALVDGEVVPPIQTEPLLDFFSYIFIGAHERSKLDGPDDIPEKEPDPYSSSLIKGYRSAVVYLYTEKLLKIDPELDGEINCMIEGYEKVINELKRRGLMKPGEGKSALKERQHPPVTNKITPRHAQSHLCPTPEPGTSTSTRQDLHTEKITA